MPRILVIDGNTAETRARHVAAGGLSSGEGYAATLQQLKPGLDCDIVRPADEEPRLPAGVALKDYAGAAITGSALNVYSREPSVQRQIELAREVFAAGVPCFGSCWGLQGSRAPGSTPGQCRMRAHACNASKLSGRNEQSARPRSPNRLTRADLRT